MILRKLDLFFHLGIRNKNVVSYCSCRRELFRQKGNIICVPKVIFYGYHITYVRLKPAVGVN